MEPSRIRRDADLPHIVQYAFCVRPYADAGSTKADRRRQPCESRVLSFLFYTARWGLNYVPFFGLNDLQFIAPHAGQQLKKN